MKNFFENLEGYNEIPDDLYEEMKEDAAAVQEIINQKIASLRVSYTEEEIDIVHDVGEQIPDHSRLFYLHQLYLFFIDHVAVMLEKKHFYAIYVLVDLFIYSGGKVMDVSLSDNLRFLHNVSRILYADIDLSDSSSFQMIACSRFINCLLEGYNYELFENAEIAVLENFKKDFPERYKWFKR